MLFLVEDDSLTIKFQGVEQLWALKRKIVISKANIIRVTWQEGITIPKEELGWRAGGTAIPGVLYAGRFARNEGLNFVYLQQPQREGSSLKVVRVVDLELQNMPYKRLLFTIDKPDIVEQIVTWWSNSSER